MIYLLSCAFLNIAYLAQPNASMKQRKKYWSIIAIVMGSMVCFFPAIALLLAPIRLFYDHRVRSMRRRRRLEVASILENITDSMGVEYDFVGTLRVYDDYIEERPDHAVQRPLQKFRLH